MKNLFFLLLFLPFRVFGQLSPEEERKIDSLKQIISTANHDTVIVNAWMDWDKIIYVSDYDLDSLLNKKIDSLCAVNLKKNLLPAEKRAFLKARAFSLTSFGLIFHYKGDFSKALYYHNQSLSIMQELGDKKGMATSMGNIGLIHRIQGETAKAIDFLSKALKIFEELGDQAGIGGTLNNLADIYDEQGDFDKSISYYEKSFKNYETAGDQKGMALVLNNLGEMQSKKGDYEKSMDYYHRSLEISKKIGYQRGEATALGYIGKVYIQKEEFSKAIEPLTQSAEIFNKINDLYGYSFSLVNLSEINKKLGQHQKALGFSKKALEVARIVGAKDLLRSASYSYYESSKHLGHHRDALEMYELFIAYRDSLLDEENQRETIRQLYKFEYEKQAAADSIRVVEEKRVKDAEISRQNTEIEARKNQQYMMFAGLILVIAFAGFIFNRFKITQRQKKIIEEQKLIVEEKNREITDSINYAKRIQAAILPSPRIIKEYLSESFILYKPKDIVAGDFYWMEHVSDHVLFAACDCTGHGVPGAMVSVVCNNGLNRSVREYGLTDPGKILDKTRDIVISEFEKSEEEVKDGMDVSLCSLSGNILHWSGANNPLWIFRNNGTFGYELLEIKPDKQPIGKYADPKPFTTHTIELMKGDTLYLFTDGFQDQFGGEKGKKLKAAKLKELLLGIQYLDMDAQKQKLESEFETWRGDLEQNDDVCLIGVRIP